MNTTFKAAAAFAVTLFFAGAACAEDASRPVQHADDNAAVITQIYAAMDNSKAKTFELVLASAERRLEAKIAAIDAFAEQKTAPQFVLASR